MPNHDTPPQSPRRRRLLVVAVAGLLVLGAGCAVAAAGASGSSSGSTAVASPTAVPDDVVPPPVTSPAPIEVGAAAVQAALGWSVAELRVSVTTVSFLVVHTEQMRSSWTCVAPGGRSMQRSGRVATTSSYATTNTPRFNLEWLDGFSMESGDTVGESVQTFGGSGFLTCPDGAWTVLHGGNGPQWSDEITTTTKVYVSGDGGNRWAALETSEAAATTAS
jgi:hypothetical protein